MGRDSYKKPGSLPFGIYFSTAIPYIAVLIGLPVLKNGWLTILLFHAGIIAVLFLCRPHIQFHFQARNKLLLAAGIVFTAMAGVVVFFSWGFVSKAPGILKKMVYTFRLYNWSSIVFIIYFSLVNPLLEELYWRILLNPKKHGFIIDILYSLYHVLILVYFIKWYFCIPAAIILAIAGMIWRIIHNKYKDDLTIVISHAIADLSIILALYFLA